MEWIQGAAASVMSAIGFEDIVQDTKKDDDKAQPASIAQTSASVATTPQGAMMTKEQLRRFFEAGAAMFAKTEVKLRLQQAHEAGEVSGDHSFLTLTSRQPSAEALEGVPESDH